MPDERTGYLYDERFLNHATGDNLIPLPAGGDLEPVEHPSAARITRRTHILIAGSGLMAHLTDVAAAPATPEDVSLYHTPAHIMHIRQLAESGGGEAGVIAGEGTPVAPETYEAAMLAVGGGMAAVDAVVTGQVHNAYALLRPPGHHAMAEEAMGFCIFNNIAIAARHAQRSHSLHRVMIVDWDVHHGNGTQAAFYDDPDVLFVSLHQDDWYPGGWGRVTDVGEGAAAGTTVNIPLPPGTGNRGYLEAFERVIGPVARQFQPELILVSAGQDPSMMDPLGRMMVTMDGFRAMAETMRSLAREVCDGRLVVLQEGGYSAAYVPFCTLGVVEGLSGRRSGVADPYARTSELARAGRQYDSRHSEAIDAVIDVQRRHWDL